MQTWVWEVLPTRGKALHHLGGTAPDDLRREIVDARERRLSIVRSREGSAAFTITVEQALELFPVEVGSYDLLVRRLNQPLFRGRILADDARIDPVEGTVTFAAVGMWALFADQYVPARREILATEAGQIAWTLISDSLTGMGLSTDAEQIVAGTIATTTVRNYGLNGSAPLRSVKEAVEELADIEPFDFELKPRLGFNDDLFGWQFNVYAPRQGANHGVVLELGRNIAGGGFGKDFTSGQACNDVLAVGKGGWTVNTTAPAPTTAIFTRRSQVLNLPDTEDATALGDAAIQAITRGVYPQPLGALELHPDGPDSTLDSIGIGDVVRVWMKNGYLNVDSDYRVEQIDVVLDELDTEKLTVSLGLA